MSTIFHSAEQWPVLGEFDVVVCGAGPAGVAAAIAAGRAGATTILIDRAPMPGGVFTQANVNHVMGLAMAGRQIVAGIAEEMVRRVDRMGAARFAIDGDRDATAIDGRPLTHNVMLDPNAFVIACNEMLDEAAVTRLYYTTILAAVCHDERITAVAVDCLEGAALVEGRTFIDATGDATVIHRAGGQTRVADSQEAMTKTMLHNVGGVERFDRKAVIEAFDREVAAGSMPVAIQDHFMGVMDLAPGEIHLNLTATTGDPLRSDEMTRMDGDLRRQIADGVKWYREKIPGFASSYLSRSAWAVGVRAGRSAVGLETITYEAVRADAPVAQPIAVGSRRCGDHGITSFDAQWLEPIPNTPRPVPLGALQSTDFRNVLIAGRGISCEAKAVTTIRYMATCVATGQAAGTCAAASQAHEGQIRQVDYARLREQLLAAGAILEIQPPDERAD